MLNIQWVLLFVMAASQSLHQVTAVKRTMPMIGMDEEGEEVDSEDEMPATEQPRSAVQALINGLLGQVLSFKMASCARHTRYQELL